MSQDAKPGSLAAEDRRERPRRLKRLDARIKILLADDHAIFREALHALLLYYEDILVVGEAGNGPDAVAKALVIRPDVVLMDILMPGCSGLDAARQILVAAPEIKVMMLSAYDDETYISATVAVGAVGFLLKQNTARNLLRAIHDAVAGKKFFCPRLLTPFAGHRAWPNHVGSQLRAAPNLTPREREILQLIAESESNKEIAHTLMISVKTVGKHRQRLMDKLGLHDTASLTRFACANGMVS